MNTQLPPKKDAGEESEGAGEESEGAGDDRRERDEDEEVLLALIHHRTKQVETNKSRLMYYTAEVLPSSHSSVFYIHPSFISTLFVFSCTFVSCFFCFHLSDQEL